jgi:hypothetical protein
MEPPSLEGAVTGIEGMRTSSEDAVTGTEGPKDEMDGF